MKWSMYTARKATIPSSAELPRWSALSYWDEGRLNRISKDLLALAVGGLYGDAGEQISSVTWGPYFPSGNGIDSIRQVRVGGVQNLVINPNTGGVPEPATWAMLLIGFGAIGATLRTRKSGSGMRLRTA